MFTITVNHYHHGATEDQLGAITHRLDKIMSELTDLQAKTDEVVAELEVSNDKSDMLIAVVTDLRAQIVVLQGQGGASTTDLVALTEKLDGALKSVKTQESEDDAALTPPTP